MGDGWISVRERLPKVLQTVLAFRPRADTDSTRITAFYSEDKMWMDQFGAEIGGVTHWREMPPPPESSGSELINRIIGRRNIFCTHPQSTGRPWDAFCDCIEIVRQYESEVKK